jgi:hypothetical protein
MKLLSTASRFSDDGVLALTELRSFYARMTTLASLSLVNIHIL